MTTPDPATFHTNMKAFTMLWQKKEPQFNEQYANRVGEFLHKSAYGAIKVKFFQKNGHYHTGILITKIQIPICDLICENQPVTHKNLNSFFLPSL